MRILENSSGQAVRLEGGGPSARVRGCTCFRIRRLARRVTQHYDRVLAPCGLRVTQFSLMSQLMLHKGMAIGPLADALDMDRTTLTRNLKPLVDGHLVRISADGDDARVRVVALTGAGRKRHAAARLLWRHAQDDINRTWGEPGVASLHHLFDHLIETMNVTIRETLPS